MIEEIVDLPTAAGAMETMCARAGAWLVILAPTYPVAVFAAGEHPACGHAHLQGDFRSHRRAVGPPPNPIGAEIRAYHLIPSLSPLAAGWRSGAPRRSPRRATAPRVAVGLIVSAAEHHSLPRDGGERCAQGQRRRR